jgi:hypothetical protein
MFSNLPGRLLNLPVGATCEEEGHETVPATRAVQGDTDSFGYETMCFCEPCYVKFQEESQKPEDGFCEWGKHRGEDIRPYRDIDEGTSGPVYNTCKECRFKDGQRIRDELENYGRY